MEAQRKFERKHSEWTGKILGTFFQLHKELGFGFSEKVYEAALDILLTELGVVLLKIKSVEKVIDAHDAQLLNYLKATELEVGLLLNFGRQAEFHRKIYDNPRTGPLSWVKFRNS